MGRRTGALVKALTGLHHIEIYVSDLHKTHDFWSWVFDALGWIPYQTFDGGFSYRFEQSYIVFVQTADKHLDAGYNRCRIGLNHLAFTAPDRAHVDSFATKLKERGVDLLYANRHPDPQSDAYTVYFEDPDRIKVEYTFKEISV